MLDQTIGMSLFFLQMTAQKKSRSVRTRDQKIQNHIVLNHEANSIAKLWHLVKN